MLRGNLNRRLVAVATVFVRDCHTRLFINQLSGEAL
jgi:hypothetical protein